MTKTNLEELIEMNIASYLQNIQFEVEDEVEFIKLQQYLKQIDLWNAAVSILTFPQSCSLITTEWHTISNQPSNDKLNIINKIANKVGYTIARKYFETKMNINYHLSPYHFLRFTGVDSVPELELEYGRGVNYKWVNFASDSKTDFILKYASATNTKLDDYCPQSNIIFSSDADPLLEVEAGKILDYLMGLYHQRIVPHKQKQDWEHWMSLYISRL